MAPRGDTGAARVSSGHPAAASPNVETTWRDFLATVGRMSNWSLTALPNAQPFLALGDLSLGAEDDFDISLPPSFGRGRRAPPTYPNLSLAVASQSSTS